uniref:EGF-like domain-containing protein n=1 Tax=Panagrellus redivivus TaxID=6233 RepID=A0A7E4VAY8_PANRE
MASRYYHCSCDRNKDYIKGPHCEIVDCNEGVMSNSTFQCECPGHTIGDFCQWNLWNILRYCIISLLLLIGGLLYFCFRRFLKRIRQNPDAPGYLKRFERFCSAVDAFMSEPVCGRRGSDNPEPAQPEVRVVERVVERVVYRDRRVEPPAYDTAGVPSHPPSYESAISQSCLTLN